MSVLFICLDSLLLKLNCSASFFSVGAMATLYIMQNDDNSAPSEKGSIAWQEKPTSNSITFTVKPREPVTTVRRPGEGSLFLLKGNCYSGL